MTEAPVSPRLPSIGMFDSGVGGLSVLNALRRRLPHARLHYVADSAHAPYGERDDTFVLERARVLTTHLLAQGARLIVVACNTATAAAIHALRAEWPAIAFVGVEPGLKPAIAITRNRRIGVMATRGTLASDKFKRLVQAQAGNVALTLQDCAGLARALEEGDAQSPAVAALVARHTAPLRTAGVDTVVLGCTHYPFAAREIAAAFVAGVALVDTAEAVAQQVERQAVLLASASASPSAGLAGHAESGTSELWTSGEPRALQAIAKRWLGIDLLVRPLPQLTPVAWCPEPESNRYGR